MSKTTVTMQDVPPAHRFIEAMSPGFMFGDTTELRCPGREWTDAEKAARFVRKTSSSFVAYRRFVYDPERGKVYMDPGWVYFKGCRIDKEDIISKEAESRFPGLKIGDVLRANVRDNMFDVVWLKECNRFYPFGDKDVFVGLD